MKKSDLLITILFLIAMVIMYFLGTCEWDLPALILGVVVAIVITYLWYRKKSREDDEKKDQKSTS